MSGLICAIASSKLGTETVVIEQNKRVGKKISATGNGKCNILNVKSNSTYFNQSKIAEMVLEKVSVSMCEDFLREVGIYTQAEPNGLVYPLTKNANSVVDCLRLACEKLNVEILSETTVLSVKKDANTFVVSTTKGDLTADQVVLACGSASRANLPNLEKIVPQKYFTKLVPSIVPLKCKVDRQLSGLRQEVDAKLICNGEVLLATTGEVMFREFGLSGICMFDFSSLIARDKVQNIERSYNVSLDLLPQLSFAELTEILSKRADFEVETLFYGLLHNKLAEFVIKSANFKNPKDLAEKVKNMQFEIDGLMDFSLSQVTAGGIDEKYLDENLTLPNGIQAIGEVLNVDGLCGGHNLYFAIASALYIN